MNSVTKQILDSSLSNLEQIEENNPDNRAIRPKETIRKYLYYHKTSLYPVEISNNLGLKPPTVRRCLAELLEVHQCFKDSDRKYGISKRHLDRYVKVLKQKIEEERIKAENILSPHTL